MTPERERLVRAVEEWRDIYLNHSQDEIEKADALDDLWCAQRVLAAYDRDHPEEAK